MMQAKASLNFGAGPCALPESVRASLQESMALNTPFLSPVESYHRSPFFENLIRDNESRLLALFGLDPANFRALLFSSGASSHYATIPLNFAPNGRAFYLYSGYWSQKAIESAATFIKVDSNPNPLPPTIKGDFRSYDYLHFVVNETIEGIAPPLENLKEVACPVIADATSSLMVTPLSFDSVDLAYASCQKNLGVSGLSVVLIKKSLLEKAKDDLAPLLSYKAHAKDNSMPNTPNAFALCTLSAMLDWYESEGGLSHFYAKNQKLHALFTEVLEASSGRYTSLVTDASYASTINIPFTLGDKAKDQAFLAKAEEKGFSGLQGHRALGGMRVTLNSQVTQASLEALIDFMHDENLCL